METFFTSLALYAENTPVTREFLSHSPVMRSFNVFFDLRLDKRLRKQSRRRWFETQWYPLWRHCNHVTAYRISHVQRFSLGKPNWHWLVFGWCLWRGGRRHLCPISHWLRSTLPELENRWTHYLTSDKCVMMIVAEEKWMNDLCSHKVNVICEH